MVDRYIYAVTQKLPQSQREDIAIELRGLIEDMLEERVGNGEIKQNDVEEVLLELGSPKEMAQKYRGTKKYLIGPELYDTFLIVLKIVLISMGAGLGIVFVIQSIVNPVEILDHFVGFIVALVTSIPQAVGWVTLVFAITEYYGGVKTKDLGLEKTWHPSMLSVVPDPKRRIKRSEPIVAIIFYVIVMVWFAFSSDFLGVYVFDGEFKEVVPFLNEDTFSQYMPFVLLLFAIFIVKECLKLITGKWTMKLMGYTVLINLIGIVVVSYLITGDNFWNPTFMSGLVQAGVVEEGTKGYNTVETIWENSTRIIVILLIVGLIWDSVEGFIRARKK
ncbi:HAAS signaling domain-containing protein [Ornithinibacillus halotolerans]|nr:hypothetical protein [Ornithinibacillus halotolerans]